MGSHLMLSTMTNIVAASGVRVHEIYKSFPVPDAPGTSRLALGGISFSIAAGELVSLVGPSGCGKSTLLRIFNRIYSIYPKQRTEGEVLLDGENVLVLTGLICLILGASLSGALS